MAGSPAVLPGHQRGSGLQGIIAAEVRGKPPAGCGLRGGRSGGLFNRRAWCQPLQPRLITLLHALLTLEQAVLRLQQPFLRALRPEAFRLFRLQLLHSLLQAIDTALSLCALARKHLALPLLNNLLSLQDALLTLLHTRFDLLLPRRLERWARAMGSGARVRRSGAPRALPWRDAAAA